MVLRQAEFERRLISFFGSAILPCLDKRTRQETQPPGTAAAIFRVAPSGKSTDIGRPSVVAISLSVTAMELRPYRAVAG